MSLTELMEVFVNDIGLCKDFITLVACTASFATIIWFGALNIFVDFMVMLMKKVKRHIYLKRDQEAIWQTINSAYLVNQLYEKDILLKEGLTLEQAELIETALIYYAKKKKYKTK